MTNYQKVYSGPVIIKNFYIKKIYSIIKDVGWSTCCIDRREFMKTLDMPSISCAKEVLGLPLAELVFCQCHDELKEAFGLTPPLGGPGDLLWVSPSDLLVGKVCLKPPLTQKHIQALTHEGIIGQFNNIFFTPFKSFTCRNWACY